MFPLVATFSQRFPHLYCICFSLALFFPSLVLCAILFFSMWRRYMLVTPLFYWWSSHHRVGIGEVANLWKVLQYLSIIPLTHTVIGHKGGIWCLSVDKMNISHAAILTVSCHTHSSSSGSAGATASIMCAESLLEAYFLTVGTRSGLACEGPPPSIFSLPVSICHPSSAPAFWLSSRADRWLWP